MQRSFFAIIFIFCVRKCVSTLLGLCTSDGVIFSGSESLQMGNIVLSHSHPCIIPLHIRSNALLAIEGDPSDCEEVLGSIREINNYHVLQFDRDMPLKSLAVHCGRKIHSKLRENPLDCRILIGGVCKFSNKPELYWVDDTGAVQKVQYSAHGRDMPLAIALLDQLNRQIDSEHLSTEDGLDVIRRCWTGIRQRTGKSIDNVVIKCAFKDEISLVTSAIFPRAVDEYPSNTV